MDDFMQINPIPISGYLRVAQIIGDKKKGIPAIIPVSRASWWRGIQSGIYPKGIKISRRCTVWKVDDIALLIERLDKGEVKFDVV
ncbi:hypothetical protein N9J88_03380 [Porticoccaceae bacterium]|nr:hypothetical protein [Porticoccaceae bacterium]